MPVQTINRRTDILSRMRHTSIPERLAQPAKRTHHKAHCRPLPSPWQPRTRVAQPMPRRLRAVLRIPWSSRRVIV